MSTETLGDLIRARRNEMGMTRARLADLVGVSPSTLSAWERGQSEPTSEDSKIALAAVLGMGDSLTSAPDPNLDGPSHLDQQSMVGIDGVPKGETRRRRGRRLRLEEGDSGPVTTVDGGLPEDGDSEYPSFGQWLHRFDPDDIPRTPDDSESIEDSQRAPIADTMGTVRDSDHVTSTRNRDPITALNESEVVNTIREADPWGTVRDSELVSTVKDRIGNFLRPASEPDNTVTGDERAGVEEVESTHSLTEDVYFEPSYVEDPDEMDHYRNRWVITAFIVIVLLMVAFWSLGQAQAALADGWERMFNMLNL